MATAGHSAQNATKRVHEVARLFHLREIKRHRCAPPHRHDAIEDEPGGGDVAVAGFVDYRFDDRLGVFAEQKIGQDRQLVPGAFALAMRIARLPRLERLPASGPFDIFRRT